MNTPFIFPYLETKQTGTLCLAHALNASEVMVAFLYIIIPLLKLKALA